MTTEPVQKFGFLTLKAFGDYVIAYASLRGRIEPSAHLVGSHLSELAAAIDGQWHPTMIAHSERSVPSVFDVRKKGIPASIKSLVELRRTISKTPADNILVFDRLTAREKLLAGGRPAKCLPAARNIYLAYEDFLDSNGLPPSARLAPLPIAKATEGSKIRIFASSRLEKKKLPLDLCTRLVSVLNRRGEDVEIISLEAEYPELEASNLPKRILPKSFKGMVDCVASSKRVISSDSLPAHIAELRGFRPVVVSPVDNSYWLPRTSFNTGAWSLFDQGVSGVLDAIERSA